MAHFNGKKNRNKARIITISVHVLLLLWFALTGLKYQDPPPEEGIAINFGYEEDGSGSNTQAAPSTPVKNIPQPVEQAPVTTEEVVTQDVEDAPVIEQTEDPVKEQPKEPEVVEEPKETPQETPTEPEPEPDPQPTEEELEQQRKQDRLNKLFNTKKNGSGSGEGETTGGGDQGDPNGDPLSPNRTGNGGIGNSGDYYLAGRDAKNRPKPINDCNKEGVVVVKIRVDAEGRVVETTGGVNIPNGPVSNFGTSTCLVDRAERAARKTTWTPKSGAGLQVGYIVYRFELR